MWGSLRGSTGLGLTSIRIFCRILLPYCRNWAQNVTSLVVVITPPNSNFIDSVGAIRGKRKMSTLAQDIGTDIGTSAADSLRGGIKYWEAYHTRTVSIVSARVGTKISMIYIMIVSWYFQAKVSRYFYIFKISSFIIIIYLLF